MLLKTDLEGEKMNKGVCFECPKRIVGCHSKCEKYLEEKEKRAKEKAEMLKQKSEDNVVKDVLYSDMPDKGKAKIRRRIANKKKY